MERKGYYILKAHGLVTQRPPEQMHQELHDAHATNQDESVVFSLRIWLGKEHKFKGRRWVTIDQLYRMNPSLAKEISKVAYEMAKEFGHEK